MKTALTIAGSDPSGGAGIQRDLRTFRDFKVRGLSAVTALTAQNGKSVKAVEPVAPRILARQVDVLLEEFDVDAVKLGMLANPEVVAAVTRLIKRHGLKNVVLDPVFRASPGRGQSGRVGRPLLTPLRPGITALKKLLPLVRVVTPNLDEAAVLSGIKVTGVKSMEEAAERIHGLGPACVLVTGGHLKGSPIDVLYDGKGFTRCEAPRIKGADTHGTGCMLSAAVAAKLARGRGVKKAIKEAKRYVTLELRRRSKI
ncbi:MAG: bifunctional hydroxymethylpyrimidine kinase/phosphomethylpyrimidine kinase [Thermodesulfobacteriota bacterium]